MKKKKIAFVIPSLVRGGAERVVTNLANYMAKILKHRVTIIIFYAVENSYKVANEVNLYNINCSPNPNLISKSFLLFKRSYKSKKEI